ncbi:5-oxoprolinase subunit PxpB [Bacillus sp. FJAT-42376]|uniref:5-oxoprolinase subunit PxpB n=1 Tax=Bacillus sp. FJAT-42376 TaxID=2014076 RepID=UPI000F50568A|nr:5-oxoprolinase subunit PxpB [Bacillus sp. FJAT-42376]AZB43931.1 5-oxoprolinase subunit PxpB [Bacillus sp. FJAT-42376]
MEHAVFFPVNEQSLLIEFGTESSEKLRGRIRQFTDLLDQQNYPWLVEYIPAFTNITLIFNLLYFKDKPEQSHLLIQNELEKLLAEIGEEAPVSENSSLVRIPVCYEDDFGMDLDEVASLNGLTKEEVIRLHTEREYPVYMIGFSPGFPYLGGMNNKIAAPRKGKPRSKIPAGSVGIAGTQTGVYPMETPGGWQIIGRTPLSLFNPENEPPTLLQAGDSVEFYPISREEYYRLKES